jgi:ribosome-associated toxin RatA of RatAB toxin-antitoxin module
LTESASERIRVEAAADRCFDVAIDFESYPEWVRDVKEARIIERDAEGRGSRVEYRAAALGKSVRYVLAYDYSNAPASFSWELVEGDMLRRLDGSYRFEPEGDVSTRVHYELSVDLAVPLPGLLKRRAAGLIMGSALKELKRQVETVA